MPVMSELREDLMSTHGPRRSGTGRVAVFMKFGGSNLVLLDTMYFFADYAQGRSGLVRTGRIRLIHLL